MTHDLSNVDPRTLREYFCASLVERGPQDTFEWLTQVLAGQPANLRSMNCSFVAYTGIVEAIDWLEANVDSPVTESWGTAATLLGVPWPRVAGWLAAQDARQLMALDTLIAYRAPAPNMSPLHQIASPVLPEPPTEAVMEAILEDMLRTRSTPRIKKAIETIRSHAPEILRRADRKVPVKDLPRLYLQPEIYTHADPILRKHEEVVSGMRKSLQDLMDRFPIK